MKEYKLRPDAFQEIKKKLLYWAVPIIVIAVAVGIGSSVFGSNKDSGQVNVLPFSIGIAVIVLAIRLKGAFKKQKALFESFTLTVSPNFIGREQLNTATIVIQASDIREITKNKKGCITIRGSENRNVIYVPAQIENLAELEVDLMALGPIVVTNRKPFVQRIAWLISFLTLGLMVTVYTASHKMVVGLSGALVTAMMLWSLVEVQRSKNIDRKSKRSMWWILVLLLSVISVTIMKLTDTYQ